MKRNLKTAGAVVLAGALFAAGGMGAATAKDWIDGSDLKPGSVTAGKLSNGVLDGIKGDKGERGRRGPQGPAGESGTAGSEGVRGAQGETGPAGPAGAPGATGATGATGLTGPQGPSGVVGVESFITPVSATYHVNVVPVPASPKNGTNDSNTVLLTFTLDEGRYLMDGVAQFFHFGAHADEGEDFGVIRTRIDGVLGGGPAWTGNIPTDGNNAGQTNAAAYFEITEDDTVVEIVGSIRGTGAGQAGAQVVVTQLND